LLLITNGPIHWKSRKQQTVAQSPAEAEFVAAEEATNEIIWARELLSELGFTQYEPTVLFDDSQACMKMCVMESTRYRTKHIRIKYNHIKEEIADETIKMVYCPSEKNLADIFTKPLLRHRFNLLRSQIMSDGVAAEEGVKTPAPSYLQPGMCVTVDVMSGMTS
jgi:hypothetical protein